MATHQGQSDTEANSPTELATLRDRVVKLESQLAQAREAGALHCTLLALLPVPVFAIDRQSRCIFANPAMLRTVGLSLEQVLGKTSHDLYPPELADTCEADNRQVLATGQLLRKRQAQPFPATGGSGIVEVLKVPLTNASGAVIGILGVFFDVTKAVEIEEQRQEMDRKLHQTQQLESLSVLAGGIAHDFNNLLTIILGNASLVESELPPDSSCRPLIVEVIGASHRAADLCRQMLAYSGRGRFVVKNLDLNDAVRAIAALFHASIPTRVQFQFDLAERLPPVMADLGQIRQVIMNLVVNAAEAIGESEGTVRIATGVMHADQKYLAQTYLSPDLPDGPYVWLEVTDTGCGMDEVTLARIFDPFFTTKFTGRGMGLSAVLGIVRGHGGAIKVESRPGQGTRLRILLPASTSASVEAPTGGKTASWKGTGTVLVVDDEESVRRVVAGMVELIGFQAVEASDGQEAVKKCQEMGANLQAVLLDLTMPGMDGAETARELRTVRPDLPVILMSGYSAEDASARVQNGHRVGFLQKPFSSEDLRDRLRRALTEN